MAYDRFLIAPFKSGLISEIKAWQIPEDAFTTLNNAYINKGVIRKRFGSSFLTPTVLVGDTKHLASRLRINLGSTDINGDFAGTVPGARFKVGQRFSIGVTEYTVSAVGTPTVMLTNGASTTHTFNTTTGAYVFVWALPSSAVYFYPAEPVMGFGSYEQNSVTYNDIYAYDTQFIYKFGAAGWDRNGTIVFHGTNHHFFMSTNWTGVTPDLHAMFVTNFNATVGTPTVTDDNIVAYSGGTWSNFQPVIQVVANVVERYVVSAQVVIAFRRRLLLLNTIERTVSTNTNKQYSNRCRYSHPKASVFPASALNVEASVSSAWLEASKTPWTIGATTAYYTGAGWIDADTDEEIRSAKIIKDRLIVYFENSTWEIVYTGNDAQPFMWQRINTEHGTDSLNSQVLFDKAIITFGKNSIHACTGTNLAKINEKIDDITYDLRLTEYGFSRICSARDYVSDIAFWSYPSSSKATSLSVYPNKILVYGYENDTWSTNDDCITAFGSYSGQTELNWNNTGLAWNEAGFRWGDAYIRERSGQVIAGNHHGYTFVCSESVTTNEHAMSVTAINNYGIFLSLTILDHTLEQGDWINFSGLAGFIANYPVVNVIDKDHVLIAGVYLGTYDGTVRVSRVSQIEITSKEWNFYIDKARNTFLAKIDFAVKRTAAGAITVDYYPSSSHFGTLNSALVSGAYLGNIIGFGTLETFPAVYPFIGGDFYPMEITQDRLWKQVYFQTEGTCVQIKIHYSQLQLAIPAVTNSDFQLEGLIVSTMPTSRLQ